MGVALSACTVPAAGKPGFTLGEDEVELGLGIHGEPGVRRAPLEPADALVDRLLDADPRSEFASHAGDRVALLVNNLGGTPTMELAIVARRAIERLEGAGSASSGRTPGRSCRPWRWPGVSLSVLRVDDARLARLDAPTEAPAWPNPRPAEARVERPAVSLPPRGSRRSGPAGPPTTDSAGRWPGDQARGRGSDRERPG